MANGFGMCSSVRVDVRTDVRLSVALADTRSDGMKRNLGRTVVHHGGCRAVGSKASLSSTGAPFENSQRNRIRIGL